jgi:hypothetical protein
MKDHYVWDIERKQIVWFGTERECMARTNLMNVTYQTNAFIVRDANNHA